MSMCNRIVSISVGPRNQSTLALVYFASRCTWGLVIISILCLLRWPQRCGQPGCVASGDHRCLDPGIQRFHEAASICGCTIAPSPLMLQGGDPLLENAETVLLEAIANGEVLSPTTRPASPDRSGMGIAEEDK